MARAQVLLPVLQRRALAPGVRLSDPGSGVRRRSRRTWLGATLASGVSHRKVRRRVFGGIAPAADSRKESPRAAGPEGLALSARRRPGYPLAGCAPAEPASVSPGTFTVRRSGHKHKVSGQGGSDKNSSEGTPFFGLDNGVHLTRLVGAARRARLSE